MAKKKVIDAVMDGQLSLFSDLKPCAAMMGRKGGIQSGKVRKAKAQAKANPAKELGKRLKAVREKYKAGKVAASPPRPPAKAQAKAKAPEWAYYVSCQICGALIRGKSKSGIHRNLMAHLKKDHNLALAQYKRQFHLRGSVDSWN